MKRTLIIPAIALVSCATVGTKIDPSAIETLKVGVTTKEDAIKMFGKPTGTTISTEGTLLHWAYAHASSFGNAESSAVVLKFGPDGKLIGKSTTESHY